jgi:prepilin-type N-terminal cleavage/methylation domain-containing protein
MFKNLRKKDEGFTIIEVLIVLAIAGIIMLIVFLAVPALQRNSRNTRMRNDASSLLSGVNEFMSNNNGQTPTTVTLVAGTQTDFQFSGGPSTSPVVAKASAGTTVNLQALTAPSVGTAPTVSGTINIVTNNGCNNNALTSKARAVAASFNVETGATGGGLAVQCLES